MPDEQLDVDEVDEAAGVDLQKDQVGGVHDGDPLSQDDAVEPAGEAGESADAGAGVRPKSQDSRASLFARETASARLESMATISGKRDNG